MGVFFNEFEAQTIAQIVQILLDNGVNGSQIGIIALYKAQVFELLKRLSQISVPVRDQSTQELEQQEEDLIQQTRKNKKSILHDIQISTVDAFQGAEKDVIILACSRTSKLGFSDSPKRLNVALTRAKRNLIIVGRQEVLSGDVVWRKVIACARGLKGGIQSASQILFMKRFNLDLPTVLTQSISSNQETRESKEKKNQLQPLFEDSFEDLEETILEDILNIEEKK